MWLMKPCASLCPSTLWHCVDGVDLASAWELAMTKLGVIRVKWVWQKTLNELYHLMSCRRSEQNSCLVRRKWTTRGTVIMLVMRTAVEMADCTAALETESRYCIFHSQAIMFIPWTEIHLLFSAIAQKPYQMRLHLHAFALVLHSAKCRTSFLSVHPALHWYGIMRSSQTAILLGGDCEFDSVIRWTTAWDTFHKCQIHVSYKVLGTCHMVFPLSLSHSNNSVSIETVLNLQHCVFMVPYLYLFPCQVKQEFSN